MKKLLSNILVVALLNSVIWTAGGDELSLSPPEFKMATADIRAVQKASTARQEMYENANKLSANLEQIVEELQQLAQERFHILSEQVSSLPENEREELVEDHRLWVEASERFIINRRLAIETSVSNVDENIRIELLEHFIKEYAQENHIDLLMRNTQILYSAAEDITNDLIKYFNQREISIDLGLDILTLDQALLQVNEMANPENPWGLNMDNEREVNGSR